MDRKGNSGLCCSPSSECLLLAIRVPGWRLTLLTRDDRCEPDPERETIPSCLALGPRDRLKVPTFRTTPNGV
jgi:hypothetical protein